MAAEKVRIRYEGKNLDCRAGTSVAAALWENGVRHLSHSPKYGRPRGVTCARGHCTACLMRVDGIPNVRTENTLLKEGMVVRDQNVKGSAQWDWLGFLDRLDWLMPAGFIIHLFLQGFLEWRGNC